MDNRCKVFTPPEIANYMLDIIGYSSDLLGKRIIENSCGEGNLLCTIVRRYIDSLKGAPHAYITEGLQKDIVGFDIDNSSCEIAKARLDNIALKYGITNVKWNINCVDALTISETDEYDFVVGNPPYISYRMLDLPTRNLLRANYVSCKNGAFDYCYAFIEHAINLLKPNGKMVYLIPSSIFKNVHGNELRGLMIDHLVEVHDYTSQKLFGKVLTSSALIYCSKGNPGNEIVYRNMVENNVHKVQKTQLGMKWVFSSKCDKDVKRVRFGDFFSTSIVIATLLNSAYIVSGYEEDGEYIILSDGTHIEKNVTRKAISPRNLRSKKQERIIFPYSYGDKGELHRYSEKEFTEDYPLTAKYLTTFRKKLEKRDADKQATWFEYGRSQALRRINQDKLLISTVVTGRVEIYHLAAEDVPYAGIMITRNGDASLDIAQRILSSMDFMLYVQDIGTYANGHSLRITPNDISDFTFDSAMLLDKSSD